MATKRKTGLQKLQTQQRLSEVAFLRRENKRLAKELEKTRKQNQKLQTDFNALNRKAQARIRAETASNIKATQARVKAETKARQADFRRQNKLTQKELKLLQKQIRQISGGQIKTRNIGLKQARQTNTALGGRPVSVVLPTRDENTRVAEKHMGTRVRGPLDYQFYLSIIEGAQAQPNVFESYSLSTETADGFTTSYGSLIFIRETLSKSRFDGELNIEMEEDEDTGRVVPKLATKSDEVYDVKDLTLVIYLKYTTFFFQANYIPRERSKKK